MARECSFHTVCKTYETRRKALSCKSFVRFLTRATSGLPHCKNEMNGEAIAHHEDPT